MHTRMRISQHIFAYHAIRFFYSEHAAFYCFILVLVCSILFSVCTVLVAFSSYLYTYFSISILKQLFVRFFFCKYFHCVLDLHITVCLCLAAQKNDQVLYIFGLSLIHFLLRLLLTIFFTMFISPLTSTNNN